MPPSTNSRSIHERIRCHPVTIAGVFMNLLLSWILLLLVLGGIFFFHEYSCYCYWVPSYSLMNTPAIVTGWYLFLSWILLLLLLGGILFFHEYSCYWYWVASYSLMNTPAIGAGWYLFLSWILLLLVLGAILFSHEYSCYSRSIHERIRCHPVTIAGVFMKD
jgi:hypothetical protein